MYCGQCGKRVLDGMLFCPFCGAPIVIPEQDAPEGSAPVEEPRRAPASPRDAGPADASAASGAAVEAEPEPSAQPEPEPAAEPEGAPEAPAPEAASAPARRQSAPGRPASLFDDWEDGGAQEPRDSSEAGAGEDTGESDSSAGEGEPSGEEYDSSTAEDEPFAPLEIGAAADFPDDEPAPPPRNPSARSAPRRSAPPGGGRRASQTFIPVRDVNPGDMFMDHIRPTMDEFDPYDGGADGGAADRGDPEDFSFEEAEPEGFVQRHIRGVVGLILLAVLLVVFLVWMLLPTGQRVLASANLAWNASVYNELGNEAYEAGQYRQAARDFERAFARDSGNYDYAHSAMVAYYEAGDTEASLAMLKRCIDMTPDDADPYIELTILHPDPATRPWEVRQLLRQGYERTGEAALDEGGA